MTKSPSLATTVYQLRPGYPWADYISRPNTLSSFAIGTRDVDNGTWVLVSGCLCGANVDWAEHIHSLTGESITLPSSNPYAVLLVPRVEWNYALVWGAGWQLINQDLVIPEFGREYGQRRLDTGNLRSVGTRTLDMRGRIIQTTIPSGSDLRDFAIEPVLSTINQIEGTAHLSDLTVGRQAKRRRKIRVGTSLRLPLGRTPRTLLNDIESIERARETELRTAAWKAIAQLEPVGKGDPARAELDARLAEALGVEDGISIGWPTGLGFGALDCDSYRVTGIERGKPKTTVELDPGYFTARLSELDATERVERMKHAKIILRDEETSTEQSTNAFRWVAFETSVDGCRYLLQDGLWYRPDQDNLALLRDQVTELIEGNRIGYRDLPTWVRGDHSGRENSYCEQVATLPGFTCLDTKLITTPMRSRVEICDLLGPDGELIHVKWLETAASASHLFEQARLAMAALRDEPDHVLSAVQRQVAEVTGGTRTVDRVAPTIILAAGRRSWNVDTLFTMSQVGLRNLARDVHGMGGKLKFLDLPYKR
jgi:uncharacterized protein (TIGR04141 family)